MQHRVSPGSWRILQPSWRIIVAGIAVLGAVFFAANWGAVSQFGAPPPVQSAARGSVPPVGGIRQIAEHLYVIPGGGSNTAVFVTSRGVVLVDPKYPEYGAAALAEVGKVTDKPISHVIVTHCHADHFGGITAVPATTEVIMQERTARNVSKLRGTGTPKRFDERTIRTFRSTLTLFDGVDTIDLHYFGPAHTDGDAFVVFRTAGVVAVGDVFKDRVAPVMNIRWGGSPREYANTMEQALSRLSGATRVITGHGEVLNWADFADYTEFNRRLLSHVKAEMKAGKTSEEARREFTLPAKFQDYRLDQLIFTLHDMYKELTPWWRVW